MVTSINESFPAELIEKYKKGKKLLSSFLRLLMR